MDIRAASEKFPWGAEPLDKLIQTSSGAGGTNGPTPHTFPSASLGQRGMYQSHVCPCLWTNCLSCLGCYTTRFCFDFVVLSEYFSNEAVP